MNAGHVQEDIRMRASAVLMRTSLFGSDCVARILDMCIIDDCPGTM